MANELMTDVRKLQKNVTKNIKDSKKKQKRRRNVNPDVKRAPSGFAKPTKISDSLCNFLGVPSGSEMARTEVTKYLTKYIKEHQLQDQANKRIINCDSKLTSLLNVKPTDDAVTYFNLQRFMKPHFQSSTNTL
jgi:chromatin remodeling complex protein RSC6